MYNILVCDDEKDIVSALYIYLSSEGYAVVPAYSGKQALEIMREQSIDLVLMDIMMPEMDGLTAVAKLRCSIMFWSWRCPCWASFWKGW